MKCISCGNLIPDASTVCPYCNNKVEPVVANQNVQGSVIPETPTQPILPQDQGMSVLGQNQGQVAPMGVPPMNQVPNQAMNPAEGSQQQVPIPSPAPVIEMPAPNQNAPVNPMAASATPMNQNPAIVPTPAPVTGVVPDGAKVGTTAPKEKKSKKGLLIVIIVIALILVVVGGGLFFYMSQYKSGNERIGEVVNEFFKSALAVKNENIELASGKYSLEGSLEVEGEKYTVKLNGLYAVDLPNGVLDYTLNAESLNMGEEIFDAGPVNLELYVADSNVYILLQNFYDKYIYSEVEGMDQIFDSIQQNDINYQTIIVGFRDAIKAGLYASGYTQTIEDVTVNGKSSKANVVRIKINKTTVNVITKAAINNLANNQMAVKELAKLLEQDEATFKEELLKLKDEDVVTEDAEFEEQVIEIYTEMFGNGLVGIKYTTKQDEATYKVEIYPVVNGYGLVVNEDSKMVAEVQYATTNKVTSSTRENTTNLSMTFYTESNGAIKISGVVGTVEDINPKVEKVNVKNSINVNYLTTNDIIAIYDEASKHGNFGLLIQSLLGETVEALRELVLPTTPIDPTTPTVPTTPTTPTLPTNPVATTTTRPTTTTTTIPAV